ncbi:receptor-type tyrosine-protein phosphatase H isoform X3 [Microcaecilia unicolor]|uniref:protein-tyrosine-phosphatase n=1 Tax=Microcaecilia unicolor TaxID=1415580 RepID=A0A6P7XMG9_9AMPH|nr:receptor-type tyrosine-protein phosphatase H isoform X3 [Microcaecilia unicolor]
MNPLHQCFGQWKSWFLLFLGFMLWPEGCVLGQGSVSNVKVVNQTETSVSLSWTPPDDINNETYTYRIAVYNGTDIIKNENTSATETFWIVTGLEPGVSYNFTIYTVTTDKVESNRSVSITATTVPSAVSNVKVVNQTETSVSLSWTPPGDINHETYTYSILMYNGTDIMKNENTSAAETSWIVTELQPGVSYNFTIYTLTTDKVESSRSVSITATTIPSTVSNVKVVNQTETSVSLSWTPPDDINNETYTYRILVYNGTDSMKNESTSAAETSWIVTGLKPRVSYNFTIYTVTRDSVESTGNASITVTTVPSAVSNVKVVNQTETSVSLSWTPPDDINNETYTYRIAVYNGTDIMKNESTSAAETSWIVTGLKPGVSYNFTIYTVTRDSVESTGNASVTVTTVPSAVSNVKVANQTETSVSLSWTPPGDINHETYTYRIAVYNGTDIMKNESTSAAETSWIVTGLKPGVSYNFTIYTVTTDEVESSRSVSITATTIPSAVSNVKVANQTETSVSLSWTPPGDINHETYIYRILVFNGTDIMKNESTSAAETSWIVTGLKPGVSYNFTIYTVTTDEVESSRGVSITATTIPSAVSNVKVANQTETSVSLSWTPPGDINHETYIYRILVFNGTDIMKNESTSAAETSWIVTGLKPGVSYNFTIYTVTTDEVESTGNASFTTTTVPSAVSNVKVVNQNETSVSLSWTPPGDINHETYTYRILVYNGTDIMKNENTSAAETSWIVTGLKPGVSYNFTIYTVTRDRVESTGNASFTTTTVPSAVSNVKVVNQNETSVSLSWTPPGDINHETYTYSILVYNGTDIMKNENTSAAETSWIVTGLKPGVSYNFTIYTVTRDRVESTGNASFTTTTAPNRPQNLTMVLINASQIHLSWMAPDDPRKNMYRYTVTWETQTSVMSNDPVVETFFNITSLDPGTLYNVSVISVIEGVNSVEAQTWAQTAPQTPESLKISNLTNTSVFISWELAGGNMKQLSGFQVKLNTSDGTFARTENIMDPSARNWTLQDLSPGTNYAVNVRSIKTNTPWASPATGEGGQSRRVRSTSNMIETFSPYLTQMILTDPGTVQVVSCTQRYGAYSLQVSWNPPKGFITEIWILVDKEQRVKVDANKTEGEVTGLQPAASYAVSMETVAYDKRAESASIICYTDNTGVIVGSVFGVLLFLALVVLLVYLVFWYRRNKKDPGIPQVTMTNIPSTLRVQNFPSYFQQQAADSDFGFAEEYQQLASVGTTQSRTAAQLQANKPKNRYTNVLPYDHSRVRLQYIGTDPSTDYINANYILGYNSDKEFIATQGPLPDTMGDFWRMVWEQRVGTVVMLTNCTESGKVKCVHYWPLDYTPCTYEDIMVTIVNETILPEWTVRDFHLKHAREVGVRAVRHFHYTVWPDFGVPHNTDTVIRFRDLVREYIDQRKGDGPTVVHCSAGVGRTGTLIALDYLMQQMEKERRIGVYSFVKRMRMNRCLMVQTESQYIFLNKCILDLIQRPTENIYENTMDSLIYENASAIRDLQEVA